MALKIFFACLFGAAVGGFVALSIWQPVWWLGMIIGGFIGYLSYEFKAVLAAIPVAWRRATSKRARARRRTYFRAVFGMNCLLSNFTCLAALGLSYLTLPEQRIVVVTWTVVIGSAAFLFLALSAIAGNSLRSKRQVRRWSKHNPIFVALLLSIFFVYIIPRSCLRGIVALAQWIRRPQMPGVLIPIVKEGVDIGRVIRKFLYEMFILVHSEIRLLCGVDAAIGAAVGYLTGHALIGALAGGLLGIVNYELVSKWWLDIVPSDSR